MRQFLEGMWEQGMGNWLLCVEERNRILIKLELFYNHIVKVYNIMEGQEKGNILKWQIKSYWLGIWQEWLKD
jgi:hypothetical protein